MHLGMIDKALLPNDSSRGLRSFALCGPGGIGKTQVAAQFYHLRKDQFDAAFWISGETTEKLATGFTKISTKLGLEKKADASDAVVSRELVKSWLEEPFEGAASQGKRIKWLLIIDSVDEPDILHDFWPQSLEGSILITSRDPLMKTSLFSVNTGADLGNLEPEEATDLLKDLIGIDPDNTTIESTLLEIAQRLNCFPLAIIQMAGVILRRSLKPGQFLDIYKDETERAELHGLRVGSQHSYSLTLSSTWALESLGPGAACLLSLISLLDGERVQESIFTTCPERGCLKDLPITVTSYSKDLTQLTKTSVVRRNQDVDELTIHSIVQDVVRSKLIAEPDAFLTAFAGAVSLLTTVWPYVSTPQLGYPAYDRVDRWEQCDKILPHILCLKQHFELRSETEKARCFSSNLLWLMAEAAWFVTNLQVKSLLTRQRYFLERSNPKQCFEFVETALRMHEYATETMPDLLAEVHGTWGIMALECNQPEPALDHIQTHLDIRLNTFQETQQVNSKLAAAYTEYGRALILHGLFIKAKEAFTKSAEIRSQMPNFTRLQLFTSLRGLALVACHDRNYDLASELLLQALDDREKAFGCNDREGHRYVTSPSILG